ncbi:MAG: hypothetical protein V1706_04750 [Pseudomonadota bacterium]
MITGYTSRYGVALGRRAVRHNVSQDLELNGWFWKLSGGIVITATLIALIGSCLFSWGIKRGLGDLAGEMVRKQELRKQNIELMGQKGKLFSRNRIEGAAAARLALYPPDEKDLGGGLVVRVPGK